MSQTKNNFPNFFKVKLGNTEYDLDSESLITSMSHQFISKTTNLENVSNYDILFQVAKTEIEEYLASLNEDNNNFIDLFGNWIDEFKIFHNKKNEPICRDLIFSFSNQSKYSLKVLDLIALKNENGLDIIDYEDPLLKSDDFLMEYIETLNWEDVKDLAEEIERPQPEPDYNNEWKSCKKEIVKWEDSLDLLDFFETDAIIGLDDMPDDKPSQDN